MFRFLCLNCLVGLVLLTGCASDQFMTKAVQGWPLPMALGETATHEAVTKLDLRMIDTTPHLVLDVGARRPSEMTAVELTYVLIDRPPPGFFGQPHLTLSVSEQQQLLATHGVTQQFPVPDLRTAAVVADVDNLDTFPPENVFSFTVPLPKKPIAQQLVYRWSTVGTSPTLTLQGTAILYEDGRAEQM